MNSNIFRLTKKYAENKTAILFSALNTIMFNSMPPLWNSQLCVHRGNL